MLKIKVLNESMPQHNGIVVKKGQKDIRGWWKETGGASHVDVG